MSTKAKRKTSKIQYQDDEFSSSSNVVFDDEPAFCHDSSDRTDENALTNVYNTGQSVLNEMISDVVNMCAFFSPPTENLYNDYDVDNKSYNSHETDSPKSLKDYEALLKEEANHKQKLKKEQEIAGQKQKILSDLSSKLRSPPSISKEKIPPIDELTILGLNSFDSTAKLETVTEDLEEDNLSSVMSSNSADHKNFNENVSIPQNKPGKIVQSPLDNPVNNYDKINSPSQPDNNETQPPALGPIDRILQSEPFNEQAKDITMLEAYPYAKSKSSPITGSKSHSMIRQHIVPSEVAYQKDHRSIYSQLSASFDDKSEYILRKYDLKNDVEDETNNEIKIKKNLIITDKANEQNESKSIDNSNNSDFEKASKQTTNTAIPIYDDESASLEFSARPLFHYIDKYNVLSKKRIWLIILAAIALLTTIIISIKYSNSTGSNIPDQNLEQGNANLNGNAEITPDLNGTAEITPDISVEVLTVSPTQSYVDSTSTPSLRPVESPSHPITKAPHSSPPIYSTLNPTSISQRLTDLILSISGSTVNDPLSFQYKALDWLIKDQENYQKSQIGNGNAGNRALQMKSFRIIQRYVLMLLYFSLSGENWKRNDGFGSNQDECEWFGIICIDSRVIEIDLGKRKRER